MSDEEKQAFDEAFRITFSGDLILLEDQVKAVFSHATDMTSLRERYYLTLTGIKEQKRAGLCSMKK